MKIVFMLLLPTYFISFADITAVNSLAAVKAKKEVLQLEFRCFTADSLREDKLRACIGLAQQKVTSLYISKIERQCKVLVLEDIAWSAAKKDHLESFGLLVLPQCHHLLLEKYADYKYSQNNL